MIPRSVNDETFTTVFIATRTDEVIRDLKQFTGKFYCNSLQFISVMSTAIRY